MPRDFKSAGTCPKCNAEGLTCRYNHFEKDELCIDSWEHKCADCGYRETTGYRSDDPQELQPEDVSICPYCGRRVAI